MPLPLQVLPISAQSPSVSEERSTKYRKRFKTSIPLVVPLQSTSESEEHGGESITSALSFRSITASGRVTTPSQFKSPQTGPDVGVTVRPATVGVGLGERVEVGVGVAVGVGVFVEVVCVVADGVAVGVFVEVAAGLGVADAEGAGVGECVGVTAGVLVGVCS